MKYLIIDEAKVSRGHHIMIDYDSYSNSDRVNIGYTKVRRLSEIPHEILKMDYSGDYREPDDVNVMIRFEKNDMWVNINNIKNILTNYHPFYLLEKLSKKILRGNKKWMN